VALLTAVPYSLAAVVTVYTAWHSKHSGALSPCASSYPHRMCVTIGANVLTVT
jgi:hypothetical protein